MITFIKALLYYPFLNLLTFYIWLVPGHYVAIGIILLTLTVRFVLLIPTKHQAESQRKTMQMAPVIAELKAKYGDDKQGLAAAQMELYKENGINPFSSCLVALIQLPVLIILYYSILHGLHADSPHLYSWIPRPSSLNTSLFGIDLLVHDKTYILPVIAAALQFAQVRMILPKKQPGVQEESTVAMNRTMSYFFPLITLYVAGNFPSGVALYWIVSTGFGVVQQYLVNKGRLKVQMPIDIPAPVHAAKQVTAKSSVKEASKSTSAETKKGVTVSVRKKS